MDKERPTVVHQALHGYADGHRLLESSISLKKSTERELSVLTDLSGSTGGERFESYMTGCPFSDEGLYALSRTWAAPEMPRPGCVWTHTLLIGFDDWDAVMMEHLWYSFSVPRELDEYAAYSRPLELSAMVTGRSRYRVPALRKYCGAIASALYGGSEKPVALVVDSSKQIEAVILGAWTQQWGSLARAFRFCSGAIQPRRLHGELFDLQCIPRRFYRPSRWKNNMIVVDDIVEERVDTSLWLKWVVDDLCEEGRTELREFIRVAGQGLGDDRAMFASVVEIFVVGRKWALSSGGLEEVVNAVCTAFPRREEAEALKVALFGDVEDREVAFLRGVSESEVLEAIVGASGLDADRLEIRRRASGAWGAGAIGWRLLTRARVMSGRSSVASDIVAGIASSITRSQLKEARRTPGLLAWKIHEAPGLSRDTKASVC